MFLPSCGSTEQHTEMVARLEKEKARLESKIKDLESSHQQTINVKDSEIARLTELNRSLEAQVNDLKAQATKRASNSQGGEEYLGHWRCKNGEVWVTKDGDNYSITYHHLGEGYKFMGRYEDGQMKMSSSMPFGDMSYSKQSGKIYWARGECTKIS